MSIVCPNSKISKTVSPAVQDIRLGLAQV